MLPRLFIEPLIFAVVLYVLTHAIGAVDLWVWTNLSRPYRQLNSSSYLKLHSTARSILVPVITSESASQLHQQNVSPHGFAFNETLCKLSQYTPGQPCAHGPECWYPWVEPQALTMQGMAIAYNASDSVYNAITLATEDSMAILTPNISSSLGTSTTLRSGIAFTFTTLGARAKCSYLNNRCDGTVLGNITNCTAAGWPQLPLLNIADTGVFSVRNDSMGVLTSNNQKSVQEFPDNTWSENPATVGIQLALPVAGIMVGMNYQTYNVTPLADSNGYTFAGCSLEYFNVTANYNPIANSFRLLNAIPSNQYLTSVLLEPLTSQYANQKLMAEAQLSILIGDTDGFNAILSQNLGRMAVAWPSGMFAETPTTDISSVDVQALGVYPMAPVIIITVLLYLYTILTLFVFFTSRTFPSYNVSLVGPNATEKMEAVALGQKWLTNPIPLVAMAFPQRDGWDGKRSIAPRSVQMIEDISGDRLGLGLYSNAQGEKTFGLKRRNATGVETRKRAGSI